MRGRSPLGIALQLVSLAAIIAVFVVPKAVQLPVLLLTVLLIAANAGHVLWGFREERRRAEAVVAAHPQQTALAARLVRFDGATASDRSRVLAVVADRNGLSFRDSAGREVLLVPAARVLSLELAPLEPRSRFRPIRVTTTDGTVDFTGPEQPDAQVDAVLALREALGRAAG